MQNDPLAQLDPGEHEWVRKAEKRARRQARRNRLGRLGRPFRLPRKLRIGALIVAILAATGAVVYVIGQRDDTQAGAGESATIDLERPFARTPVQDWADGAAGIVPPQPKAVGGFDAGQVRAALAKVKDILVAGRVDRGLVEGGDTSSLLALLAESHRAEVEAELTPDNWQHAFATRLAPGFRLAAEPKVRGTMSVRPGDEPGTLAIDTSYVFAYAFRPDDPSGVRMPMDIVAGLRWDLEFVLVDGEQWYPEDRGIRIGQGDGSMFGMACGPAKQGLLAPPYSERSVTVGTDHVGEEEFYDPERPVPDGDTCE